MKTRFLFILGAIVCFILAGFILFDEIVNEHTKLVDCYDRYNNKIIGQECIQENGDMLGVVPLLVLVGAVLLITSNFYFLNIN